MASFTASPASGIVLPLTVAFDASASSDPESAALTFAWTFGDGASGTGPTASHDYAAAGSYNVALTVTDDGGKTATATTTVTAKKKGVRS